jgi:hypothetical protein
MVDIRDSCRKSGNFVLALPNNKEGSPSDFDVILDTKTVPVTKLGRAGTTNTTTVGTTTPSRKCAGKVRRLEKYVVRKYE